MKKTPKMKRTPIMKKPQKWRQPWKWRQPKKWRGPKKSRLPQKLRTEKSRWWMMLLFKRLSPQSWCMWLCAIFILVESNSKWNIIRHLFIINPILTYFYHNLLLIGRYVNITILGSKAGDFLTLFLIYWSLTWTNLEHLHWNYRIGSNRLGTLRDKNLRYCREIGGCCFLI